MQSVSSRVWTRVAVSISYDDNHYTTGTSRTASDCEVQDVGILEYNIMAIPPRSTQNRRDNTY